MSTTPTPLSPTLRTTLRRKADRSVVDRRALHAILDEALVCHLGVVVDGEVLVLPTAFGYDPDGPDRDGTLYLHGSVASASLLHSADRQVCVTVTLVDGLVLARSGFHHSMNYRSAVVRGQARIVDDPDERARALDIVVDHVVPGRTQTLRRPTRKELAATMVVAVPLHEASVKARTGDPLDDDIDLDSASWSGVVGVRTRLTEIVTADDSGSQQVPDDVRGRADTLA